MDITILAVSKRLNGVCIAGVDKNNKWIRPVKKEELMLEDIKYDKGYITALNTYELHFFNRCPVQCQTENYLLDDHWPIFPKGEIQDRIKFFIPLCENSLITNSNITEILKSKNRSLIMLGPVRLTSAYFHKEEGKYKAPEITFSVNGIPVTGIKKDSLLCTDLKFYSFGKTLLKDKDEITLDENELKKQLGYFRVYVVIGLTKLHKGVNWPMVIGLHTVPGYEQVVEY